MSKVTTAKPKIGGAIHAAPAGTTLPTSTEGNLDDAFKSLGYTSEEGLVNKTALDSKEIKAWGGDVVATPILSRSDKFSMTMLEALNIDVLKEVYGEDNVTGSLASGISVNVKNTDLPPRAWVIDMILTEGALKRIVIPAGKITEVGDIVYKDNELVGYETTITGIADAAGNTHYEYIKQETV